MRRRSTFIIPEGQPFKPDTLKVTRQHLLFSGVKAAREEQIKLGLEDLPEEVRQLFLQAQELHIRWASEKPCSTTPPFLSRLPPGLHVFYRPADKVGETGADDDLLCAALHKYISNSLKCRSTAKAFIPQAPSTESSLSHSPAVQYYSVLPSLSNLIPFIQRTACLQSKGQTDKRCLHTVSLLNLADSLDIDYNSVSGDKTVTVTVFWSKQPGVLLDPISETTTRDVWNVAVEKQIGTGPRSYDRVEVGILNPSEAQDAHDIQLSGLLTRVGEDDQPKPTHFHFPSRHHKLPGSQSESQQYTVSVSEPQGLHPTLEIEFVAADDHEGSVSVQPPSNRAEGASQCGLYTYLTLPSSVFVDEYAFKINDPLFNQAHGIKATRSILGETDLEAPEYVVDTWGSTVLLELEPAALRDNAAKVTVPLHLRYLEPSADGDRSGIRSLDIPWPVVFWACSSDTDAAETINFNVNPFDRIDLGYDSLLHGNSNDTQTQTMFYHLDPRLPTSRGSSSSSSSSSGNRLVQKINVPVYPGGSVFSPRFVEVGTLLVILVGFVWVAVQLLPLVQEQVSNLLWGVDEKEEEDQKVKKSQ